MSNERRTEAIVGITVLVAVIILIVGVYWGKGSRVLSSRQWLKVHFDDVRGLEVTDPVFVRGIKKGQVEEIGLGPSYAEVRIWVMKDVALYSDMRVSLANRELMGGVQIVLFPGESGEPADLAKVYRGETSTDLNTFVRKTDQILRKADSLFIYLNDLAKSNFIGNLIEEADHTMENVRLTVVENRTHLRNTLARLDTLTYQFQAASFPSRVSMLIDRLDSTVTRMNAIVMRIEDEEGTMGKLVRDRWLYDQLLKTTADVDSLISDLQANPKKYVRFSLC